ncbi:conserved hypothetical protein (plasmid) [Sinorhizobium fredii NGR234]|uniref:Uncharacterized protein n=1 Tax=Sinorhizobium fredii (strain NBRC 101917 / NGR234) TaxID=394 RepID=C3KMV6_SINFN|nr:hypothetical protein [Sinorhizobium fredii]ACP21529.1 conserved hypothetical protein [Sinorhizobium fredii NGR234]
MKILIEVDEAAERLEELIDLAFRQDVCVPGRAAYSSARRLSQSEDLLSNESAETLPHTGPASKLVEGGKLGSIDDVWILAAEGKPGREHDMTSAHDDLYDVDGLPR